MKAPFKVPRMSQGGLKLFEAKNLNSVSGQSLVDCLFGSHIRVGRDSSF